VKTDRLGSCYVCSGPATWACCGCHYCDSHAARHAQGDPDFLNHDLHRLDAAAPDLGRGERVGDEVGVTRTDTGGKS
jgi:hypothetical protein